MNSYYRDSTVSVSMATIDHKHTLLLVADIKRTLKIILESKSEFDFISLPTHTHTGIGRPLTIIAAALLSELSVLIDFTAS